MKGSLFYRAGDIDKAILYWKESIKLNRNQNDVRSMLNKAEQEVEK